MHTRPRLRPDPTSSRRWPSYTRRIPERSPVHQGETVEPGPRQGQCDHQSALHGASARPVPDPFAHAAEWMGGREVGGCLDAGGACSFRPEGDRVRRSERAQHRHRAGSEGVACRGRARRRIRRWVMARIRRSACPTRDGSRGAGHVIRGGLRVSPIPYTVPRMALPALVGEKDVPSPQRRVISAQPPYCPRRARQRRVDHCPVARAGALPKWTRLGGGRDLPSMRGAAFENCGAAARTRPWVVVIRRDGARAGGGTTFPMAAHHAASRRGWSRASRSGAYDAASR